MSNRFSIFWKPYGIPVLLVILSLLLYYIFAYNLQREDFPKLIVLFSALFFCYYLILQSKKLDSKLLLTFGILFRLVFLITEPNLSQDFYRFIWDGELIKNGVNPYIHLPNTLILDPALPIANAQELYAGMGELSAKHFSNYPPVNQFLFTLSAFVGNGSILGTIITMRLFIILADIGILYFGKKLLQKLNQPSHMIFWYFLNPLVILELTGNLHFEGVMLFFFIWSLYLIKTSKWFLGAPIYAIAILVKLVPVLFLPLFLKYFGFKKSIGFYILTGATCLVLLLPFYNNTFINNYSETVGLWFSNFEFNAGMYNLVKKIGVTYFDAKPWELIKVYGKIVAFSTIIGALLLTFFRKNQQFDTLVVSMLALLSGYYFLSSTLHPWYIVYLLVLCVLTNYRYPILWSFVVILSYYAYSNPEYQENLWLLAIEYILVFGFLIYEIAVKKDKKLYFFKKLRSF
ncbi:polyprenol phosphomannose-dependent alpha 1,6 mannosyltransferase MptB [Flagellimonas sp. HMM57]|nr:polyprenol phosphomannose-dependent alpha 1,6 mannosyltransferase MptB [Flagellimonas sp. HMM57]UII74663.1 polyprenol phosphomannose-dependent alpha 1,6 mannosyltransferase MptB [Flagellimonas sp. HMM57]